MTKLIDGIEFPDDMSDSDIADAFKNSGGSPSGSGTATPPTAPVGAGPSAPASDQPSFISRMLSGWAQQPRIVSNALTGGLSDVVSGAARTLLPGSGTIGQNIKNQQQMTTDANTQVGVPASMALNTVGMLAGPGKLSKAGELAGPISKMAGYGLEGAAYGGEQAGIHGEDVAPAMAKGAAIGAGGSAATSALSGIAGKIASKLPEMMGGPPAIPNSAGLLAGNNFKPASTYATADKLKYLETMQKNKDTVGMPLSGSASRLLTSNANTGMSKADQLGMTPDEQGAIGKVGNTTPVASYFSQHPFQMGGAIHALTTLPELIMLGHGGGSGVAEAGALGMGNELLHIGGTIGSKAAVKAGEQSAFDAARRTVGGVPTTGAFQDMINSPDWKKQLQMFMLNQGAGQ